MSDSILHYLETTSCFQHYIYTSSVQYVHLLYTTASLHPQCISVEEQVFGLRENTTCQFCTPLWRTWISGDTMISYNRPESLLTCLQQFHCWFSVDTMIREITHGARPWSISDFFFHCAPHNFPTARHISFRLMASPAWLFPAQDKSSLLVTLLNI